MTSALNLSTKLQSNAFPPANTMVTVSGGLFFLISFGSPHVLRAYMGHTCGGPNEIDLPAAHELWYRPLPG